MINIPSGAYNIAGSLLIDQPYSVEFKGSGHETTIIDGSGVDRILWVSNIDANVIMRDLHLTNGFSQEAGGAIFTHSEFTLERVIISHSASNSSGGGVAIRNPDNKTLRINDSVIRNNAAGFGGGISLFDPTTKLELNHTEVISNTAGEGGGLDLVGSAVISHSIIANNVGFRTGGLRALANLIITDSSIVNNRTSIHSGGIAISYPASHTVQALIQRSLIANNQQDYPSFYGGGISVFSNGTLTLEDSTISGNRTNGNGGGLYVEGVAFLRHVTLTGNKGLSGVGIYRFSNPPGSVSLTNSILWNNQASGSLSDCTNGITGFGANIISFVSSCAISGGTTIDIDPLLAGLDDHGGPTLTHMPAVNSPAVDAIECFIGESTDQRGQPRPQSGLNCDIGAVERKSQDFYRFSLFIPVILHTIP